MIELDRVGNSDNFHFRGGVGGGGGASFLQVCKKKDGMFAR